MQNFHYLLLILFSLQSAIAQNNLTQKEIDKQLDSRELIYPENEEHIKEIDRLIEASKKISYKSGAIEGMLRKISYANEHSDFKKMLWLIDETEALGLDSYLRISRINVYKGIANDKLGFAKTALQNLHDAVSSAKRIENSDRRHEALAYAYNIIGTYHDQKNPDSVVFYTSKELDELEKISDNVPEIKFQKYSQIAFAKINFGLYYVKAVKPQRLDLAEPYFKEVSNFRITQPEIFEVYSLPILCSVGEFYLAKGDYEKTIEIFTEVLQREKSHKNLMYRSVAFDCLADAYEELNNPQEQVKYVKLSATLNDSLNKATKQEVGPQFDKLITKAEQKKEKEFSSSLKIILIAAGCFVLIVGVSVWLYWRKKNQLTHKRYEEIIAKVNLEKEPENLSESTAEESLEVLEYTEAKHGIQITDETTKILLHRLEKFEKTDKYLRKDISLTWLANSLNTNTKYLSEIIKINKNKSFSNYINGLKIDYVIKKLVSNPQYREYKISYLADECGFASRQVFVIGFKKETGFTPSYFIENLKKDQESSPETTSN